MLSIVRSSDGVLAVFWETIGRILMYVFLIGYIKGDDGDLADVNIFTIIALFESITFPIGILPWAVNDMYKCSVSFARIRRYLSVKEIAEEEITRF
jgi:ATP-binding cassette subfamily C (CFTR/MRP) protein 1